MAVLQSQSKRAKRGVEQRLAESRFGTGTTGMGSWLPRNLGKGLHARHGLTDRQHTQAAHTDEKEGE